MVTRSGTVSLGAMTCSPWAVVQPALDPPPCDTPRRKDTLWPGSTVSALSGSVPKKSEVVCRGEVGRAVPERLRNWMPG